MGGKCNISIMTQKYNCKNNNVKYIRPKYEKYALTNYGL